MGHKAYKDSRQIDTYTVHNATDCVDFVKKDTFTETSFVENLPKKTSVCFFYDKVVSNIQQICGISFIFMDVEYHQRLSLESPVIPREYVFTRFTCYAENDRSVTAVVAGITNISFPRIRTL